MSDPAPVSAGSEPPDGQEGLAEMLAAHEWRPLSSAHNSHQYDAWCAICIGDVTALAAAVAPWVAQRETEALREAAEGLNLAGVGFRSGWGSGNPEDLASLDVLTKAIQWLRALADRTTPAAVSAWAAAQQVEALREAAAMMPLAEPGQQYQWAAHWLTMRANAIARADRIAPTTETAVPNRGTAQPEGEQS